MVPEGMTFHNDLEVVYLIVAMDDGETVVYHDLSHKYSNI